MSGILSDAYSSFVIMKKTVVVMGTIANAKVTHYYNCYNGYFVGCLRKCRYYKLIAATNGYYPLMTANYTYWMIILQRRCRLFRNHFIYPIKLRSIYYVFIFFRCIYNIQFDSLWFCYFVNISIFLRILFFTIFIISLVRKSCVFTIIT